MLTDLILISHIYLFLELSGSFVAINTIVWLRFHLMLLQMHA